MDINEIVISIIGSLTGASGLIWAFFKIFANKLIDRQFQKSIESYKFLIDSRFDRISKIHEKEFEILPLLWELIISTNTAFYSLTSEMQTYPDLSRFSEQELVELFSEQNFRESEIKRIMRSPEKQKEYIEIDYWKKMNSINKELSNFDMAYNRNKIFLTDETNDRMVELRSGFIEMASVLRHSNHNGRIDFEFKSRAKKKQEELNPTIDIVGKQIKERLRFKDAF